MLLLCVYSPIQLYIQRYTRKKSYIKPAKKDRHMNLTTIYTYVYHHHAHTFCHFLHKKYSYFWNMTIWTLRYTEDTGWRHFDNTPYLHELFASPLNIYRSKIILQRPSKWLKPLHTSLYDWLPTVIIMYIEIWLSCLEHCNKFNRIVSRFKTMCKPILYAIPHYLWTPYRNFGALCWYNAWY